MSKGAMSRMGRRDGLFVLYSITVLLHSPVCVCRWEETKQGFRIVPPAKIALMQQFVHRILQKKEKK